MAVLPDNISFCRDLWNGHLTARSRIRRTIHKMQGILKLRNTFCTFKYTAQFFLCIAFSFFAAGAGVVFAATADRVLATVNNEIITLSDYRTFIAKLDHQGPSGDVDERMLKNLIEEKVILQHAKKLGIDATESEVERTLMEFLAQNNITRDELVRSLSEEGMSFDDYKKLLKENLVSLKAIDREVNSKVLVSEAEITAYYQANSNLFMDTPEKMEVKAILMRLSDAPSLTEVTDMKIKALKISEQIKSGESFDKMVNLYSDPGTRSQNGFLGEFAKGVLIPSLDSRLSRMKQGEISEPIWTKEGVYILQLVRRQPERYVPVEMVRQQIQSKLYDAKKENIFNNWMKQLWEKSSIKIK